MLSERQVRLRTLEQENQSLHEEIFRLKDLNSKREDALHRQARDYELLQ
jgi:cell division protein FtsB